MNRREFAALAASISIADVKVKLVDQETDLSQGLTESTWTSLGGGERTIQGEFIYNLFDESKSYHIEFDEEGRPLNSDGALMTEEQYREIIRSML